MTSCVTEKKIQFSYKYIHCSGMTNPVLLSNHHVLFPDTRGNSIYGNGAAIWVYFSATNLLYYM